MKHKNVTQQTFLCYTTVYLHVTIKTVVHSLNKNYATGFRQVTHKTVAHSLYYRMEYNELLGKFIIPT